MCQKHLSSIISPCLVDPCHHVKARPYVANGGEGLQIWRAAANIFNKSRTAGKGWFSSLGIGRGAKNPLTLKI